MWKTYLPSIWIMLLISLLHGCKFDEVAPATKADFDVQNGLIHTKGETVTFSNTSRFVDQSSFRWVFGDGAEDSVTHTNQVTHVYASGGNFTVRLVAFNKDGYATEKDTVVTILGLEPMAQFQVDQDSCQVPCLVQFTDESVNHDPSKNRWDFGDGVGSSTDENPSYTYTTEGMYTARLIVSSESNETDTTTRKITVYGLDPPADADFTILNNNCTAPCEVSFVNTSTNGVRFEWDFTSDGIIDRTTTDVADTVRFGDVDPGEYDVKLIAYNGAEIPDSITRKVFFQAPIMPIANFNMSPDSCEVPCSVSFTNFSQNADSFRLDYGISGQEVITKDLLPPFTYTTAGEYEVILTAYKIGTNDSSSRSKILKVVSPGAPPVADFDILNNNCTAPCTVQFVNQSLNAIAYEWDFGDPVTNADTSSQTSPSYIYTSPGNYTVSLTAINANQVTDVATRSINIQSPSLTYEKRLGSPAFETIRGVAAHPGGGYVMVGSTRDVPSGRAGWLVRVNELGDTLWTKKYYLGGFEENVLLSVHQRLDGNGFVLGGYTMPTSNSNVRRGWIIKVDTFGTIVWNNATTFQNWDRLQEVIPSPQGGYIGVGRSQACASCVKRGLFVRASETGLITADTVGDPSSNPIYDGFFNAVYADPNGQVYLAGHAKDLAQNEWEAWVVKYNLNNNVVVYDKFFGDPTLGEDLWDVIENPIGNLVFCGRQNDNYAWLFEMSPSGNFVREHQSGISNTNTYSIIITPTNQYALTGYIDAPGLDRQLLLITVNPNMTAGNIFQQYGSPTLGGNDQGYGILPTSDGGFFIGGFTVSLGAAGSTDAYYLRTDSNGLVQ